MGLSDGLSEYHTRGVTYWACKILGELNDDMPPHEQMDTLLYTDNDPVADTLRLPDAIRHVLYATLKMAQGERLRFRPRQCNDPTPGMTNQFRVRQVCEAFARNIGDINERENLVDPGSDEELGPLM